MNKFSIIVPVYNVENYLRECLDSLVNQTWQDIEIILINDGSTDGSGAICESYCHDPRVIYRCQENAGPSAARNLGLSLATGDYIAFVDSDDWLELDAMERLQNETADIVIYNFYHGNKMHTEPLTDGIYGNEALFPNMISYVDDRGEIANIFHNLWMRLFRRALIERNNIRFDTRFSNGEDLLFTYQATLNAASISIRCSEYLYHYRQVSGSLTSKYIPSLWPLRKLLIEEIYGMIHSEEVLLLQMPLRIFSWAVAGIENELRYPQGNKELIQKIVSDPVCDSFKGKLDVSLLNEKNGRYYYVICDNNADSIWNNYKKQKRKNKIKRLLRKAKRFFHFFSNSHS